MGPIDRRLESMQHIQEEKKRQNTRRVSIDLSADEGYTQASKE